MELLIGLAIAGFAFVGIFVMPWVNRGRINDLERELKSLRVRLSCPPYNMSAVSYISQF